MADINENQHHSRPSRYTWLIGLVVVLAIAANVYWAEVSAFVHFPKIKNAFGL
jgi:hypothetical protein